MQHNTTYTFLFAAAICVVCGVLVSTSAVSLADRQEQNAALDKMKNVLTVSGLAEAGQDLDAGEVQDLFEKSVKAIPIDLATGEVAEGVDPATYDQSAAAADPNTSRPAPANNALIKRLPNTIVVYEVADSSGEPSLLVLPIEGYGLWSTLYGFLALDVDLETIRGISYYQHGETAGLGGEVDNPSWKALWPGRKAFDESGEVAITVIKGSAGPPESNPHQVDGLAGATLTANGVQNMLRFWLSEAGYGSFFEKYKSSERSS